MANKFSAKQVLNRRAEEIGFVRLQYRFDAWGDKLPHDEDGVQRLLYPLIAELYFTLSRLKSTNRKLYDSMNKKIPGCGEIRIILQKNPSRLGKPNEWHPAPSMQLLSHLQYLLGCALDYKKADGKKSNQGRKRSYAKDVAVQRMTRIWEEETGELHGSLSTGTRFAQFMAEAGKDIFSLSHAKKVLKSR